MAGKAGFVNRLVVEMLLGKEQAEAVLSRVGDDPSHEPGVPSRLGPRTLSEEFVRATGRVTAALDMVRQTPTPVLGLVSKTLGVDLDVRMLLLTLAWLSPVTYSRSRLRFRVHGKIARLSFWNHEGLQSIGLDQVIAWRILKALCPVVQPVHVSLPISVSDGREEFEAFFGHPVEFGADIRCIDFALPSLDLLLPSSLDMPRPNGVILGERRALARYRQDSRRNDPFGKLEQDYEQVVAAGESSRRAVATLIGLDEVTLARDIASYKTSHRQLLDDARRWVVLKQLCAQDAPVVDIARRCGFSHATALHRAFVGWTGLSPQVFRTRYQLLKPLWVLDIDRTA